MQDGIPVDTAAKEKRLPLRAHQGSLQREYPKERDTRSNEMAQNRVPVNVPHDFTVDNEMNENRDSEKTNESGCNEKSNAISSLLRLNEYLKLKNVALEQEKMKEDQEVTQLKDQIWGLYKELKVDYKSKLDSLQNELHGYKDAVRENDELAQKQRTLIEKLENDIKDQKENRLLLEKSISDRDGTLAVTEGYLRQRDQELENMEFRYDAESERVMALEKSYHNLSVVAITVGSCLGVAVIVLVILLLVKMRRNNRKSVLHRVSANNPRFRDSERIHVGDDVISRKLQNNRPPIAILVGDCEKFGFSEVYDVGTKGNVVRMTRPRETARASRMYSEGLLNIQPIYHDQEERNAEFSTTSSDVLSYGLDNELSRGIEWWRRKEFWAGWEYPC